MLKKTVKSGTDHSILLHMIVVVIVVVVVRKEAVDDVEVTQEEVEKIANKIEEKLFNLHGNISTKYKTKYRSLLFNLKDSKNQVCLILLDVQCTQSTDIYLKACPFRHTHSLIHSNNPLFTHISASNCTQLSLNLA